MKTFTYHINLNERGLFYADVRDERGQTVFEIKDNCGHVDLIEDGFMSSVNDVDGLAQWLRDMDIIGPDDELTTD